MQLKHPRRQTRPCAVLAALLLLGAALPASGDGPRAVVPRRPPIRVALTVDDLPRPPVARAQRPPREVIGELLSAFERHELPPVTGFVNGAPVRKHPEDQRALREWVRAGQRIGNHGYAHLDPARVPLEAYLRDVDRNEGLLRALAGPAPAQAWKLFRYPFLQEGTDLAMRQRIRAGLAARGYRLAPVTIDFRDWAWDAPFARCRARGDEIGLEVLRKLYRDHARQSLRWSHRTAGRLFGRPLPQVLLVHAQEFTAEMMDTLLDDYAREGVRFVPLEQAIADPIYTLDTYVAERWGSPFLHQFLIASHTDPREFPTPPVRALESLCR
jgi:peptidoglycan/xylan/chitin deacetylase (PgdA/CDA1 family)